MDVMIMKEMIICMLYLLILILLSGMMLLFFVWLFDKLDRKEEKEISKPFNWVQEYQKNDLYLSVQSAYNQLNSKIKTVIRIKKKKEILKYEIIRYDIYDGRLRLDLPDRKNIELTEFDGFDVYREFSERIHSYENI